MDERQSIRMPVQKADLEGRRQRRPAPGPLRTNYARAHSPRSNQRPRRLRARSAAFCLKNEADRYARTAILGAHCRNNLVGVARVALSAEPIAEAHFPRAS